MSNPRYYLFDVPRRGTVARPRHTVIYCASSEVRAEVLDQLLTDHFEFRMRADEISFIGPAYLADEMRRASSSQQLESRLEAILRHSASPSVKWYVHDGGGQISELESGVGRPKEWVDDVVHAGLQTMFLGRGGVLDSRGGYHYVKPSGRHSDKFIRAGNVFLRGSEVSFAAFGLLRVLPDSARHIYTDTASINWLAERAADLRQRLAPSGPDLTVDSFSSYAGLAQLSIPSPKDVVVLISASTTGGLLGKVKADWQVTADQVITLYFCGNAMAAGAILCDVTRTVDNPDGIAPFLNYGSPSDCALCAAGSLPLTIAGDQFLPASPRVRPVLLAARHAPPWLRAFADDFVGTGAVAGYAEKSGSTGRRRQLHVDAALLMDSGSRKTALRADFDWWLESSLPAGVQWVVHLEDAGSTLMAELVRDHLNGHGISPALMTRESLERVEAKEGIDVVRSVVVAAGAVVTGRQLLGISQLLRKVCPGAVLNYVIGVGRPASESDWRDTVSSLAYGPSGPGQYPVKTLRLIELPDDSEVEPSAWATEEDWLVARDQSGAREPWMVELRERLRLLRRAASRQGPGLSNDLFLPPLGGAGPMRLRDNFAFWSPGYPVGDVSQADVLLTVAAVLHALRRGGQDRPALLQGEHDRAILHASNFTRFNDGVVQAALLRSAFVRELDYSQDERSSALMVEVVEFVAAERNGPEGEAFPEFLLALALGRLRLAPLHAERLGVVLEGLQLEGLHAELVSTWISRISTQADRSSHD